MADSDALRELTIEKNGCIILEMPQLPWTESMYREIEGITVKQEITPIIAHVDRYVRPFQTTGMMNRLGDLPVLVQANANFFLQPRTRRTALRLLREDRIHLLGSDCHNLTTRLPNMGQALETIERNLGSEVLSRIEDYQRMLLQED